MPDHATISSTAVGGLLAFAAGDALGWPLEGRGNRVGGTKDLKPTLELIAWTRKEGGRYAPFEEPLPAGTYSDDTQLTLAVARSLRHEDWWAHLTAVELPWWLQYGLGGGGATRRAAQAWSKGTAPWSVKGSERYWDAGGNGAAMRVFPHIFSAGSYDEIRGRVLADGAATHGHPIALVGAQAYAYALWVAAGIEGPLGWGQLLDEVIRGLRDWGRLDARLVPMGWVEHLPSGYQQLWGRTVEDFAESVYQLRNELAHGALSVEGRVLDDLGAFSSKGGAGTVTAAAALYLTSRFASDPRQGVLKAAFARGADTDTLAAMTGALLGLVHGSDWLGTLPDNLMDAEHLRRSAQSFDAAGALPAEESYSRAAQRRVDEALAAARPGDQLELPFYGPSSVIDVRDHDNRTSHIRSWWLRNEAGQTFRISKTSKAQTPPWVPLRDQPPDTLTPKLRSGLILTVADVAESREFYEKVLRLEVTRETRYAVVFAGWLALEQSDDEAKPPRISDGNSTIVLYTDSHGAEAMTEHLSQMRELFHERASERGSFIELHDPDGNAVHIRWSSTPAFA